MKKRLLLALLLPSLALAEITPPRGQYDPRVRTIDYNPQDVVRIPTFYGVSTHIRFDPAETIRDVAVGDDKAWVIVPRTNHLFVKPKDSVANTNITVVTDKRVYQFALVVHKRAMKDTKAWADPNLVFSLSFRYPNEEAAQAAKQAEKETLKKRLDSLGNKPDGTNRSGTNRDYWVAGSEEISPTAAYDDGRFIYLIFSNNRDMPAVYAVNEDDSESLVNTHVASGNTIVVHRLIRRLMLRRGNAVASIVNRSFDSDGGSDNTTGTVSTDLRRVIKGGQP